MFYLVQRLTHKSTLELSGQRRIDDLFDFDYMGSAEFEFGAIPRAYQRMLSFDLSIHSVELTRNGVTRTVYFIASDDAEAYEDCYDYERGGRRLNRDGLEAGRIKNFEQALDVFKRWFEQPHLRGKEITYFDMFFEDSFPQYMNGYRPRFDAWWALDENIVWTLDESIAHDLLEVLSVAPRPVKG